MLVSSNLQGMTSKFPAPLAEFGERLGCDDLQEVAPSISRKTCGSSKRRLRREIKRLPTGWLCPEIPFNQHQWIVTLAFALAHVLARSIVLHESSLAPAGGIVDHPHQVAHGFAAALQPIVIRGVPLHQFAVGAAPRPPLVHVAESAWLRFP